MTPRDLDCRELVELVTEYLEGALPAEEALAVDQHLDGCDDCARYVAQVRAVASALGRIPVERLTETLPDRVLEELLSAFRARH